MAGFRCAVAGPGPGSKAARRHRHDLRRRSRAAIVRRWLARTRAAASRSATAQPDGRFEASWQGSPGIRAPRWLAQYAGQVAANTLAVARSGCTTSGTVVAADRDQPVLARRVLLAPELRGQGQVPIGIGQFAGVVAAVAQVAQVGLAEAGVDAGARHVAQCLVQAGAGLGAEGGAGT